jgi:hypothetical protein
MIGSLMLVGVLACSAQQAPGEDPATIIAAWKKRSEEIRSFRISWQDDELQTAGSLKALNSQPYLPPTDTIAHKSGTLEVSGDKISYLFHDYVWSIPTKRCNPSKSRSVYRDRAGKTLVEDEEDHPTGYIANKHYYINEIHTSPIYLALRPAMQGVGVFDPDSAFVKATVEQQGRRVVILRTASPTGFVQDIYAVPSEGYRIIKYEASKGAKPRAAASR